MNKLKILAISFVLFIFSSCNQLNCERHFLKKGFTGKVTIYFEQKNGQKQFDDKGCILYSIPENGEVHSAMPFKEGTAIPKETFRFFEVISADSLNELFCYENEYVRDTLDSNKKKFIFCMRGGIINSKYGFEYYVDYGSNYLNYYPKSNFIEKE